MTTENQQNNETPVTFTQNPIRFFKNIYDMLKCTRKDKLILINQTLRDSDENTALSYFRSIAGQLSGSECAYADIVWNIFGTDTSRKLGEPLHNRFRKPFASPFMFDMSIEKRFPRSIPSAIPARPIMSKSSSFTSRL